MRYAKKEIITDKNGVAYYESSPPEYYDETNADIRVVTEIGDRLDLIANQFYGDSSLWYLIADANNLNLINVPAGIKLRIPPKPNE